DRSRATQGPPACDALHSVQAERGAPLTSPEPRGGARRRVRLVALAVGVTALDQLTKLAVVRALPEGDSRPVIDDFLRLSDLRNSGAAFGTMRGFSGVLALAALVGVIGFLAVVVRNPGRLAGLGAALVAGGALGNL